MRIGCHAIAATDVKIQGSMTDPFFFNLTLILLLDFLQREVSQGCNCRVSAELTVPYQNMYLQHTTLYLQQPLNS